MPVVGHRLIPTTDMSVDLPDPLAPRTTQRSPAADGPVERAQDGPPAAADGDVLEVDDHARMLVDRRDAGRTWRRSRAAGAGGSVGRPSAPASAWASGSVRRRCRRRRRRLRRRCRCLFGGVGVGASSAEGSARRGSSTDGTGQPDGVRAGECRDRRPTPTATGSRTTGSRRSDRASGRDSRSGAGWARRSPSPDDERAPRCAVRIERVVVEVDVRVRSGPPATPGPRSRAADPVPVRLHPGQPCFPRRRRRRRHRSPQVFGRAAPAARCPR